MKILSWRAMWLLASFCCLALCLLPMAVGAQDSVTNDSLGVGYMNSIGLSNQDPRVAVARIIQIALGFLGTLAVILVIYAGFLWMTSEGNADKLKKAKEILKSAAVGLLIILSAFAIVTFVIDKLNEALGNGSGQVTNDQVNDDLVGLGAIGSGIIQSVYPSPGQTDVPRNTSVIVTFREKIKVSTICQDGNNASSTCSNANIVTTSIKFFHTETGDDPATNLATNKVKVSTTDGKTFVFVPVEYLGSASTNIWQSIKLTTNIQKANNQSAFTLGDFTWQFEVSTKVDLTPPQVQAGGVVPFPDNDGDGVASIQTSTPATATISVSANPQVDVVATAVITSVPTTSARLEGSYNCASDGIITATVITGTPLQATTTGLIGLVNDNDVSDGRINLGCGLVLIKNGNIAPDNHGTMAAGNSWEISVTAAKIGTNLTVGNQIYHFVSSAGSNPNNIIVANELADTVSHIIDKINQTNGDISASLGSNNIILQARVAGIGGNSLVLLTDSSALWLVPFSGGQNRQELVTINDLADTPRNSIIQINFSEAINPLTVVGTSAEVSSTISVVNASTSMPVNGRFVIANQYRTLEFIPSLECGTNACGDIIYCLPANSHLVVEIKAASLAPCTTSPNTCLDKTPYNDCDNSQGFANSSCRQATNDYYPLAALPLNSGLADTCFNSLDGNRDAKTVGPVNFYNENTRVASSSDSYKWSFFVNDDIDLTPPRLKVESLSPMLNLPTSSLNQLIEFSFDKLMMASTINSGEVQINNQNHRLINLFSAGLAPSYWLTSQAIDDGIPDGYPDFTKVFVNHGQLADATIYSVEVGSGVKDSRQNCFKPCRDNANCAETSGSCCNGTARDTATTCN
jgi:hypothetical protein